MNESIQNMRHHYLQLALTCIGFIIIAALLQATNGIEWASMGKTEVQNGEFWRVITGHLIHADWNHFAMNMIGLSLCVVVYRLDINARHWIASFIVISLISSGFMFFTYFSYERYLGFSDVLHGWILVGALGIAHKEPKFSIMIFVLFWLKIIEENMQLPFFTSYNVTGHVAKESHIYGAIGGIAYSLFFQPSLRQTLIGIFDKNK